MTPSTRPSTKDRILDTLFGGPVTAADRAKALAERPPLWVHRAVTGLFLIWACLFTGWCLGALGWLSVPREEFTMFRLLWINGFGVALQWIDYGIAHHYRKRARQASKAASTE